jgi:RimJ/RimL family protein N-acetyltransferase
MLCIPGIVTDDRTQGVASHPVCVGFRQVDLDQGMLGQAGFGCSAPGRPDTLFPMSGPAGETAAVIETPRLLLRQMGPADVDALEEVFGDSEAMRFYPAPFSRGQVQAPPELRRIRLRAVGS